MKTKTVDCDICRSNNYKVITILSYGESRLQIVKCKECGLKYMRNRPSDTYLKLINSLNYEDNKGFDRKKLLTTSKYEAMVSRNEGVEAERLRQTIEPLKKLVKNGKPNILDVGCGKGLALEIAETMGFECYGIEISEEAIKGLNYKVFNSFEEIIKNDILFDVVLLSAVIEHLPSPKETLFKVKSLLKHDGILVIFTDNEKSIFKILGRFLNNIIYKIERMSNVRFNLKDNKMEFFYQKREYKNGIEYLEPSGEDSASLNEFAAANLQHIYLFEPLTLKKLLTKVGYNIVYYPSGYMFEPVSRNRKIFQNRIVNNIAKFFGMQMNIVYYCKKTNDSSLK